MGTDIVFIPQFELLACPFWINANFQNYNFYVKFLIVKNVQNIAIG
jgi:hypothetical protein